ncbi:sigma-54 dependent transcriptional regulator [Patescibacteria group bacterium]|nr:sigma-54 dependent transcriptional regulator [bacterium]MBU0999651.1 sigma-54 dependent transcriptional regulator [Patescibacteria group bacterium]
METILIVDDNADLRFNLSNILQDEGYNAVGAGDGKIALKAIEKNSPNLVLLDIRLPESNGMEILEKIKKIDKDLIIIMCTAYCDVKDAVKAMKLGAFDYITKPFDNEEMILTIKKALKTQYLSKEVERLRKRLGEREIFQETMGQSLQIKKVIDQVEIIAPINMTVILQGKSGTGKELIANLIHQKSSRKDKPFIPIDCGAIPESLVESELFGYEKGAFTGADDRKEGKFEQADGGTLFLDEITNVPLSIQAKLLRVIEERKLRHLGGRKDIKIDVRIIVATATNLWEAIREGKFRDDLFYRLNEFDIDLPLLRQRKDDIPTLTRYFLDEANCELNKKIKGISPEAIKCLLSYHWPGNVRELKNVIKKAVLMADSNEIGLSHLSLSSTHLPTGFQFQQCLDEGAPLHQITKKATQQIEQQVIKQALAKSGGNKTKAAKLLKIDRMTLYSKIKEFQLE